MRTILKVTAQSSYEWNRILPDVFFYLEEAELYITDRTLETLAEESSTGTTGFQIRLEDAGVRRVVDILEKTQLPLTISTKKIGETYDDQEIAWNAARVADMRGTTIGNTAPAEESEPIPRPRQKTHKRKLKKPTKPSKEREKPNHGIKTTSRTRHERRMALLGTDTPGIADGNDEENIH
jgi:hypothetical protein